MKLWLIERPADEVEYDQYDAKIVRAETADAALALAGDDNEEYEDEPWMLSFPVANATITEVTADGKPGVILGSFCAG